MSATVLLGLEQQARGVSEDSDEYQAIRRLWHQTLRDAWQTRLTMSETMDAHRPHVAGWETGSHPTLPLGSTKAWRRALRALGASDDEIARSEARQIAHRLMHDKTIGRGKQARSAYTILAQHRVTGHFHTYDYEPLDTAFAIKRFVAAIHALHEGCY